MPIVELRLKVNASPPLPFDGPECSTPSGQPPVNLRSSLGHPLPVHHHQGLGFKLSSRFTTEILQFSPQLRHGGSHTPAGKILHCISNCMYSSRLVPMDLPFCGDGAMMIVCFLSTGTCDITRRESGVRGMGNQDHRWSVGRDAIRRSPRGCHSCGKPLCHKVVIRVMLMGASIDWRVIGIV